MTANDVLLNQLYIGGDIEFIEGNTTYRGPLKKMREENGAIFFDLEWCAINNGYGWSVHNLEQELFFIQKDAFKPLDIGHGRIRFRIPYIGHTTISPKGVDNLNPRNVKGLILAEEPS